jgi:hypothetical protein
MTEQKSTDGLRSSKRVRTHSGMSGVLQERERSKQGGAEDCQEKLHSRLSGEAGDCQEWLQTVRIGCRLSGVAAECQDRLETVRSG